MNVKASNMSRVSTEIIRRHFQDVKADHLWNVKKKKAFVNVPRALPIIMVIIDSLSNEGPISSLYLSLWCRTFAFGTVKVDNPRDLLVEMGQGNRRSEEILRKRLLELDKLGFIDVKWSHHQEPEYVLVLNPYVKLGEFVKNGSIPQYLVEPLKKVTERFGSDDYHLIGGPLPVVEGLSDESDVVQKDAEKNEKAEQVSDDLKEKTIEKAKRKAKRK